MRILRATHALRNEAERGATTASFDDLQLLLTGSLQTLRQLSHRFATADPGIIVDQRPLFGLVEEKLKIRGAPASIGSHLDEVVNAINTGSFLSSTQVAVPDRS